MPQATITTNPVVETTAWMNRRQAGSRIDRRRRRRGRIQIRIQENVKSFLLRIPLAGFVTQQIDHCAERQIVRLQIQPDAIQL